MRTACAVLVAALALGACGGGGDTIHVLAAASLTEAFTRLAAEFEARHDVDVALSFAASSELVAQIGEGAPADVLASADEETMARLRSTATEPVVFARNRMAIAVEPGNPLGIADLTDLADADLRVVLCAEQVPCGRLADEILARADVEVDVSSRAESVKAALATVASGEADAAIVYVTDVEGTEDVEGVAIADAENAQTALPIAALTDRDAARRFVDYVRSPEARRILVEEFSFTAP